MPRKHSYPLSVNATSKEQAAVIAEAADLAGLTLSGFMLGAAIKAGEKLGVDFEGFDRLPAIGPVPKKKKR
jgi:uncharacterized protein (DUF1778 family)